MFVTGKRQLALVKSLGFERQAAKIQKIAYKDKDKEMAIAESESKIVTLAGVEHQNMEGVLATARAEDHAEYVAALPSSLKEQVRHSLRKKK